MIFISSFCGRTFRDSYAERTPLWLKKIKIEAEDLSDKPLILSRRNLVQKQMVRWFGKPI